ncbi:hypothetical protein Tco_0185201 [Tanacetum coccineum]
MEQDLRTTKQTYRNAILSLVKKVKTLETSLKRKTKKLILSESEEEELESQGRKIHIEEDDPLISLVKDLLIPAKDFGKASGEAQDKDISPTTLEAAKILSKVVSQKSGPKEIKQYSRRKISFEKVKSGEDSTVFEEVSSAEVNIASINISTASIPVSTSIEFVSTDSTRVSAPSPPRTHREGKAPITEEDKPAPKKSKIQILQEEASLAKAVRLQQVCKVLEIITQAWKIGLTNNLERESKLSRERVQEMLYD